MADVPIIHYRAGSVDPSFPNIQFYERKATIRARRMTEIFSVETPHGMATGGEGDYLVVEPHALWAVPKDVFESLHRQLDTVEGEMLSKE